MVKLALDIHRRLGSFDLAVECTVEAGLVVLFGPSGCGKSSTLAAIAGLGKPDRGRIDIDGETLFDAACKLHLPPQRRRIGFVFQNAALFPHLRVAENICFGIDREPKPKQQERLESLLSLLRLEALASRYPRELSGGEQQRVALARALAPEPRLLLLDEPFSALDLDLREELRTELKRLQRYLSLPMVMVTHSRAEALQLADTLVRMETGTVVAVGPPGEILAATPWSGSPARFSW